METKKILIIDDSATTRSLINSVIAQIPYVSIIEAKSGFEALKILPSQQFDLVVTDINMPDINGLEVISFLKSQANYKNIPVIIISTESTIKDRRKGILLGADEYITKPFKASKLFKAVEQLLLKKI